jgi:hypothetical protein
MCAIGVISGMISGLWTRIIKPDMIFEFIGNWFYRMNNVHLIQHNKNNPILFLVRCIFCFSVWICFILDAFYIIEYNPYWIYAIIGVFGSLGAGNLVAEIICSLRSDE